MARGNFLRILRISLLLYVLAFVAVGAWLSRARATDWDDTLYVAVYPIVGDGREQSARYVDTLDESEFDGIERFLEREARRYGISVAEPLRVELGAPIDELPPAPPGEGQVIATMWWSLKLRWWSNRMEDRQDRPGVDARIYVLFFDPEVHERLAHSLGIAKGLIGVVSAYAHHHHAGTNNVVIAHELLHTLGATDKYDPATNLPRHPEGYADPEQRPLHPQQRAELMGGRIVLEPGRAEMPESLQRCVVGPRTAREIGWTG